MSVHLRTRLQATTALLILASVCALVCHYEAWQNRHHELVHEVRIDIPSGSSFAQISTLLQAEQLVVNRLYFEIYAYSRGLTHTLQAGEYSFSGSITVDTVLTKIAQGQVVEYSVMLPEGGTFQTYQSILSDAESLSNDIDKLSVDTIMDDLGLQEESNFVTNSHGEGWFFPDTYTYIKGTRATDLLKRAHQKMLVELERAWEAHAPTEQIETPYQFLTLAAIIEKESALREDQHRISGVFVRRLTQGMRLQSDPTVIYGLGELYDGNLTRNDLRNESLYNTYRHHGLPPTPICAPSRQALDAAAHPADGNELYFVARGDGSSEFSSTLSEHNEAVRKYQLTQ